MDNSLPLRAIQITMMVAMYMFFYSIFSGLPKKRNPSIDYLGVIIMNI